jgi:hypothetical protein
VLTPVDKLWKVQRSFHRLMGQAKTLSKKELLIRFRRWEKQFAAAVPVQLPPLPPLTIVPEPPRAGKKL